MRKGQPGAGLLAYGVDRADAMLAHVREIHGRDLTAVSVIGAARIAERADHGTGVPVGRWLGSPAHSAPTGREP